MPGGYGTDESTPWGSSGDTGANWNTPSSSGSGSSNNNNNNNNNYGWVDENAIPDPTPEEVWAHTGGQQPDTYIPPEEYYGPGQPSVGASYNWTVGNENFINNLIQDLSPTTLDFWGISPNSTSIPNELLQMLVEGSIVSGNEAVESDESYIGTWSDLEDGNHPLLGGTDTYYDIMNNPTLIDITNANSGNNPGGSGWGGNWGGSNLNYGNRSGYGKYADWGNRPHMLQDFGAGDLQQYYASLKNPGQPRNQQMFKNMMGNMYNSGIRSLG